MTGTLRGGRSPSPGARRLTFHPATPDRWGDIESLFGERGACGGCWCMWERLTRAEFAAGKGAANKRALRRIVAAGETPGILAYADGAPAGWCAIAPRETYSALARSRTYKPVDDLPVWSVVCFFVGRPYRRQGLSVRLLRAAVGFARSRGARIVEGYPVEPMRGGSPDPFVWRGLPSAFQQAGFVEALRRSATRPIMRYHIGADSPRRRSRKENSQC